MKNFIIIIIKVRPNIRGEPEPIDYNDVQL